MGSRLRELTPHSQKEEGFTLLLYMSGKGEERMEGGKRGRKEGRKDFRFLPFFSQHLAIISSKTSAWDCRKILRVNNKMQLYIDFDFETKRVHKPQDCLSGSFTCKNFLG